MLLCTMPELLSSIALLITAGYFGNKENVYGPEKNHAKMSRVGYAPVDPRFAKLVNWADIHPVIKIALPLRHR